MSEKIKNPGSSDEPKKGTLAAPSAAPATPAPVVASPAAAPVTPPAVAAGSPAAGPAATSPAAEPSPLPNPMSATAPKPRQGVAADAMPAAPRATHPRSDPDDCDEDESDDDAYEAEEGGSEEMASSKTTTSKPSFPERATTATNQPTTVALDEFVLAPDLYCHRDKEELKDEERLKPLMDSLVVEGLQTRVEFYLAKDGKPVITKGHRRITAMRLLAKQNAPGFAEKMPVDANEVIGATDEDLICRSVADNANRKDFSVGERMRAAKILHLHGVEHNRAAYALGYSKSSMSGTSRSPLTSGYWLS